MKKTDFSFIFKIVLPLILIAVLVPVILIAGPDRKGKAPERQETAGSGSSSSSLAVTESDSSSLSGTSAREDASGTVIAEEDIDASVIAAVNARVFAPDPSLFWSCVPAYYTFLGSFPEKATEDNALGLPCIQLDDKEIDRVGRLLYADYSGYPELVDLKDDPDALGYAYKENGIYYACCSMGIEDTNGDIFALVLNDDGSADIELHMSFYVLQDAVDSETYRVHLIKEYSEEDGDYIVRVQSVTLLD